MYGSRTDLLVGFRWYQLSDRIGIQENLLDLQEPLANTTFDIHDGFRTENDFYGCDIGFRSQVYRGRWSLELLTKLAVGNTHQIVAISGQTVIDSQPPLNGGILALPTNIGTYQRNVFTVIPQLSLELGYQINCHWRAYAGYNVLYWGSVRRAADQIDLNVDSRNFPSGRADCRPALPGVYRQNEQLLGTWRERRHGVPVLKEG